MTENQEIELPILKTGIGFKSAPDYTLIFKNAESKDQWVEQIKGIPFAQNNHYLVGGHICVLVIEEPKPPVIETPKQAPSISKTQSFTIGNGKIERLF